MKNKIAQKLDIDPIELLEQKYPDFTDKEIVKTVADRLGFDTTKLFRSDNIEDRAEDMENDFSISTKKGAVKALEKIAGQWNIDLVEEYDSNPIDELLQIEDDFSTCVFVDVDMTDQQVREFTQKFYSEYVRKYNRDPKGLFIIRNDITGVSEMSPSEIRERVEPWLNDNEVEE